MAYYSKQTVRDRLDLRAMQLNEVAETLPHGDERELLLHRARRMAAASQVIDSWESSPGLRPPR